MTVRFDEVELFKGPDEKSQDVAAEAVADPVTETAPPAVRILASRSRRMLAFTTDASLFLALGLAMSPLLDVGTTLTIAIRSEPLAVIGFTAFLLLFSYYYFVSTWVIWGKTVGGSIFDMKVAAADGTPIDVKSASLRWSLMWCSILTAGIGFAIALLPGGRSMADLISRSRSFVSSE